MDGLAPQLVAPPTLAHRAARVLRVDGHSLLLVTPDGALPTARRAVSCLVAPQDGDRVLFATLPGDEHWVLAVLEHRDPGPTRIEVDGDLELRAPTGTITAAAAKGVTVATGAEVAVLAGSVRVVAQRGLAALDELTVLAEKVDAEVTRLRATFTTVDTVMERLSQRAKRVYRFVGELDQLRARRADYSAQETFQVHAHDTLLTSEQLVKIDGDQIHVG
ncbi:MAG: uncharacterized protein JWM10_2852 [Myxococcaceae bacterium]|nr:uncharacterized protein [Myxococcaceae bacterium]